MAALPTEKLSPSPGRHAGGYLVRFTRSSVIKLIKHSKWKRERYIWESLNKNFRDVLEMNSPSFKSAMSFTWVEKSSWTTTLLTLICFLHKKSKILRTWRIKMTFQPVWFSLFTPIMEAEDDGEGACRQQLFAELVLVLKYRIIFSEGIPYWERPLRHLRCRHSARL